MNYSNISMMMKEQTKKILEDNKRAIVNYMKEETKKILDGNKRSNIYYKLKNNFIPSKRYYTNINF